jgi:hypothetical protein
MWHQTMLRVANTFDITVEELLQGSSVVKGRALPIGNTSQKTSKIS